MGMLPYNIIQSTYALGNRFYGNTIPLTELTYSEKKIKKLAPQKTPSLFPIEQIRFWRRHELLPFFEEGKHAQVSMGQYLWLRFLQILKNFGCSIQYMQQATLYFIKQAYDDDLVLKNLLAEKDRLTGVMLKNNKPIAEQRLLLDFVKGILADPLLQHSIKMEVNYFTTLIVYSLSTGKSLDIVMDQLGQFAVSIDGQLYNPKTDRFEPNETIAIDEPFIHIPIRNLLIEFFDNPKIDDKTLSVIVLSQEEQDVIRAIREKSVNRINVTIQKGKIKRFDIEKTTKKAVNDPAIREIKKILGLKNYQEIKCIAPNDKEVIIIKNTKKIYE
jgi:hypothetical protein